MDTNGKDSTGAATTAPEKEGGKSNLNLSADELKEEGNRCVKAGNFTEAILHYTHAIKLSPSEILYSNRSLAFLKGQQYYYANEDADRAIGLNPTWAKGYYRKAEVHMAVGQYDTALLSYGKALQLQGPQDMGIIQAARKAADLSNRDVEREKRTPVMGAGIGCVVGMCIVMADMLLTDKPTIKYTSLMVLVVLVVAGVGFGIAKMIRYYTKLQRKGLLDPPIDLLEDFLPTKDEDSENGGGPEQKPPRNRYSKAQARQRFKKGKT